MDERSADLAAALADRYQLGRELGRGGMAVVYLARDLKHDRDVAIKVLHADLTSGMSLDRFAREVRIAAGLQHPHILPVYDSGAAAGQVYCVMPYVSGETLRARLIREKALPVDDAVRLACEVAAALTHAHEHGVVHRDIKPENVLLADGRAIVADFGIAKAITAEGGQRLTQTGLAIGTPHYMSPEQASGETDIDGRSDIYSLACMTYEMFAGEPPFVGPSAQAIIARQIQQEAPSVRIVRQSVPEYVDDALRKGLAKQAVDRFPTAAAFAAAISTGSGSTASVRRRRGVWGRYAAAAAVTAVVAIGARAAWDRFGPGGPLDDDLVAIAPFDVADESLAPWRGGLLDLVTRTVHGAGSLRVVPASVVSAGWAGQSDEASAVRLGRRTAAGTGVVGALYRIGSDSVRVTLSVFDVGRSRLVGDVEKRLPTARMDQAADSIAIGILQVLGSERPLGSARPPSTGPRAMAAVKTYLQGEAYYRRTAWDSAQLFYERAVQLDTAYALAYHRLAFVQREQGGGFDTLAYFNALRAGRLVRGLPERDSLILTIDSLKAALQYQLQQRSNDPASDSLITLFRARLNATFDVATRRIANDPELWYSLATHESGLAGRRGRDQRVFDALSRTIRLDSTFLPAYEQVLEYAAVLGGPDSTRRYLKAYVARRPTGVVGEAARLAAALFDPRTANAPETARLLDAASPAVLFKMMGPLFWWNDSAETGLRVARKLLAHPDRAQIYPADSLFPRFLEATFLASRGHMRDACAYRERRRFFFPAASLLGCVPRDTALVIMRELTRSGAQRPSASMQMVAWWGEMRDTAQLEFLRRSGEQILRTSKDRSTVAGGRALVQSAAAFLDLIRGDSASALQRLISVPDSLCNLCDIQYLAKSRLLAAAGRTREALDAVDQDRAIDTFPMAPVLRLQLARLAEQLGDRPRAIANYRFIAEAWQRGDPAMRDSAAVALAGLKRLGEQP